MRGVDTNLLVRYLTLDEPAQAEVVIGLFERAEEGGETLFIAAPVLCELVWVLRSPPHRAARERIAEALRELLASAIFDFEHRDLVQRAVADYQQGPGDFADYLIGWLSRQAGCDKTLTFDQKLADCERFEALEVPSR